MPRLLPQRRGSAWTGEVGAELLGLDDGPLSEVAAGDAGREPEVVLDARACRCLATDSSQFNDQGSQSLRGAIDSRCQTGRPSTDDDEVETALGKAVDGQAEVLRKPSRCRVAQERTGGDHDRQLTWGDGELAQEMFDSCVAVGVEPLMRDAVAGQELSDPQ